MKQAAHPSANAKGLPHFWRLPPLVRVSLEENARGPVSRVLSRRRYARRHRIAGGSHSSRPYVAAWLKQPTRAIDAKHISQSLRTGAPPLFGLAPGGVCRASLVTKAPVRSYRTLSPLPHKWGGLLSVALSLDFAASNSSGGRYPPPLFRGARTFLAVLANPAAARPPGEGRCRRRCPAPQACVKNAMRHGTICRTDRYARGALKGYG